MVDKWSIISTQWTLLMDTFQLAKFYDKAHIFRAKYGRINFALGRWTTTVPRYRGARGKVMSYGANKLHMPYLTI